MKLLKFPAAAFVATLSVVRDCVINTLAVAWKTKSFRQLELAIDVIIDNAVERHFKRSLGEFWESI